MDIDAIFDRIRQILAAAAVAGIACGSAGCATRLPSGITPPAFQTTAASPVQRVQETQLSDLIMACVKAVPDADLRRKIIKRLQENWQSRQLSPEMAISECHSAIEKEMAIRKRSTPSKAD